MVPPHGWRGGLHLSPRPETGSRSHSAGLHNPFASPLPPHREQGLQDRKQRAGQNRSKCPSRLQRSDTEQGLGGARWDGGGVHLLKAPFGEKVFWRTHKGGGRQ